MHNINNPKPYKLSKYKVSIYYSSEIFNRIRDCVEGKKYTSYQWGYKIESDRLKVYRIGAQGFFIEIRFQKKDNGYCAAKALIYPEILEYLLGKHTKGVCLEEEAEGLIRSVIENDLLT